MTWQSRLMRQRSKSLVTVIPVLVKRAKLVYHCPIVHAQALPEAATVSFTIRRAKRTASGSSALDSRKTWFSVPD
jgi:hypothetical protein